MQDKNDASGFDVSVGFSTTNQNKSGNIGLGVSNNNKDWVNEQSSIIGIEKSDISVNGNTNIKGAVLGGGDTTLNTGTLSYGDIHDKEKGIDVGVGVSVDFGGGKSADNKSDNAKSSSKISSASLGYGATDREQINRGTIGKGTVVVGGIKVTPGINRDEGQSQEVTKDINVDKIDVKYTADRLCQI